MPPHSTPVPSHPSPLGGRECLSATAFPPFGLVAGTFPAPDAALWRAQRAGDALVPNRSEWPDAFTIGASDPVRIGRRGGSNLGSGRRRHDPGDRRWRPKLGRADQWHGSRALLGVVPSGWPTRLGCRCSGNDVEDPRWRQNVGRDGLTRRDGPGGSLGGSSGRDDLGAGLSTSLAA